MKVIFANETYDCTKAVRTETKATLYLEDGGTMDFIGVSDWGAFALDGGEWSAPAPTREDRIEAQATFTAMMTDTLLPVEDDDV